MIYCFNPACGQPRNPDQGKFCSTCGQPLLLGDRYGARQVLNQGSKGRTFLGIDRGTFPESYCIIKQSFITQSVNAQQFISTFQDNADRLKTLGDRPEFPTVLDIFLPKYLHQITIPPTLVFEKIVGDSLRQQLTAAGPFSEDRLRQFLREILPLVQLIHDHGLIHRDLHPENVLLTPEHHWAIVDFTAAKVTSKMASAEPGTLIGSGIYTAPEQLRGQSYPASDLYSLGVICLELLTSIHPFDLYSVRENRWVWRDYLTTPISSSLGNLLEQMVAEIPGDRPKSAQAILAALFPHTMPKQAKIATPPKAKPPKPKTISPAVPDPEPQWHCFRTLRGHHAYISDLQFAPDSYHLASAAADQTIRLWDLDHRQEASCLRGHRGIVSSLIFWGDRLISGSWDYTIRLWDWQQGEQLTYLEGKSTWIQGLAFWEKTKQLAALGADQNLTYWDLAQEKVVQTFALQNTQIIRAAQIPGQLWAAQGNELSRYGAGDRLQTFTGHQGQILDFQISPNGQFLLSSSADQTLKIWPLTPGKQPKTLRLLIPITKVAIAPNLRFFVGGDRQGILAIWQLGQEQPMVQLPAHNDSEIQAIAISPNSQIIATAAADKTIKLWRFGIQ
ncbi:WD40 repeat domain-containing serine/threonine-protein kinase [Picosynechococcus sp. NKBG15041c]|uniref:WD40 repeat domain-containing serine/threonine-protein kinase n=1 Tax=Picosynechococcus sp. NKBG15041c TaxID=1407650 RepID=UPI000466F46F|nr:WD40 repeat domain-containing serine/threonine-protein kinase [Picosynechococcus sp. NKBG15041c]